MKELTGKTAIVTGGSRGIGRAIAIALAEEGADIGIVYVNDDQKANDTKKEIEALGVKCTAVKCDLRREDCAATIKSHIKTADILIHNASIQYRANWEDITVEQFNEQINCNLRSVLLITQAYIEHMKQNKWGKIITIGSVQELKPHKEMLVYSSAKAALTMMAKSLALRLADYGINVNCIAPGIMLTDRNHDVTVDKQRYINSVSQVPFGRLGEAEECAGIAKLLCTKAGEYITGQNIFVDGGMGIK